VQGRPVSQCAHCRTLRKSRSAHVRCDCGGEKTHHKGACTHDGDSSGEPVLGYGSDSERLLILDVAENCGCSHGTRCSCALKKEHLDPVRESDSDEPSSVSGRRRPRALTAQSESGLTTFTNGHHKPVHKHNTMAHKCGLPYVVPKTIHGSSPTSLANRSVDSLPHTSTIDALHSESLMKDSMVSAQQEQRMVKSEHGSPSQCPTTNLDQLNGLLPPLDLSRIPSDYDFMQNIDGFPSVPDPEQPLFSAGLSSASIDWSHYDGLGFNNNRDNFAPSSYSQAPSFTGFDFTGVDQPALTTTSTSGEISEVEDFGSLNEIGATRPSLLSNKYGSDFDTSEFGSDVDTYRLSTASSYIGMPQAQILARNDVETLDLDTFLEGVTTSSEQGGFNNNWVPAQSFVDENKPVQTPPSFDDNIPYPLLSAEEENRAFWTTDFPFPSSNIPINRAQNGALEENVWAQ
jgi:hypothetical protein